jgi:hypothetical protein
MKMGHYSATHDDACEATTRSVGCAAAFLPRMWFRKEEQAVSEPKSARAAPFVLEIGMNLLDPVDHAVPISAKPAVTWFETRENDSIMLHRRAASLKIGSGTAGQNFEEVKTPTLSDDNVWTEMRRRFRAAHRIDDAPAARASSEGAVSAPARRKARDPKRARSKAATRRGALFLSGTPDPLTAGESCFHQPSPKDQTVDFHIADLQVR